MSFAVLLYKFANNPRNAPAEWPVNVVNLEPGDPVPPQPWIVETKEQLLARKATYQAAFNAWKASLVEIAPVEVRFESVWKQLSLANRASESHYRLAILKALNDGDTELARAIIQATGLGAAAKTALINEVLR